MAQKLKVFTWSDGFHAHTVAVSSRPKALAAWGVSQDIFKSGLACEVHDGPAYEAALKSPGEVIETGEAVDLGKLRPAAEKASKPDKRAEARKARIVALRADLDRLEGAHSDALAAIDAKVAALHAEREALEAHQNEEREGLVAKLKKARAGA